MHVKIAFLFIWDKQNHIKSLKSFKDLRIMYKKIMVNLTNKLNNN
jgi:hypothetical protein